MNNNKKIIRRILGYTARYRLLLIPGMVITLMLSLVSVLPPLIGQLAIAATGGKHLEILDKVPVIAKYVNSGLDEKKIAEEVIGKKKIRREFAVILFILAFYVIMRVVLEYFKSFLLTYLSHTAVMKIRTDMISSLTRTHSEFFKRSKTGELLSRMENDTKWIENFIYGSIPSALNDPLALLLTLSILFILSWKLTLASLLLTPLMALVIFQIGKLIGGLIHKLQEKLGNYISIMQQILYGIDIIKVFCREEMEKEKFSKAAGSFLSTDRKLLFTAAANKPAVEFFMMSSAIVIISYGGHLVFSGNMPFDHLWGFILFLLNISQPINSLSNMYMNIKKARAAGERVFEIIDLPDEENGIDKIMPGELKGSITFKQTVFSYPRMQGDQAKQFTLGPVTFNVKAGETVALVGESGGGKSTLASLIPMLITPGQGEIFFDGIESGRINRRGLRRHISLVSQESILFYGTVIDNIRYGRDEASEEEVTEAAKLAHAHDFIIKLPCKYNTVIGERGITLSGGQRQRLSLARALIKKPRILILDEATSALDTESENHIQSALKGILHRQTTIIIAHRLSTVKNADRIFVIEKGKIIESGSHAVLMKKNGKYRRLYSLQFR
ncbi:MAG TPA: ABC transporter ATP-binding protein [Spirochaetia bacterium]|nr:ABC transporter ATP-binding protein [Spirochaetia bacterium]